MTWLGAVQVIRRQDQESWESFEFAQTTLWLCGYVLSIECLCTTQFVMRGLYDKFVDPFSLLRKSLFFGFLFECTKTEQYRFSPETAVNIGSTIFSSTELSTG
jgi:hypothetical protein